MKSTIAYIVVNKRNENNADKRDIAGVFWAKQNAKRYAWQLNVESSDANANASYVVEEYVVPDNAKLLSKK